MTSQNSLQKFDEKLVVDAYARAEPTYKELCREARYILERKLAATDIKIHGVEDRVKALASFLKKAGEHGYESPFEEVLDIAGLRIICLFRDDLKNLEELIRENFTVQSIDDKTESTDAIGYQSIHFVCTLPEKISGPRYDHIANLPFEIQIRTLCMHCWATVSHYIDYKGDWDVPNDLKKSLNALSGLFFVADSEFQQFNLARLKSKRAAEADVTSKENLRAEINFDTMSAYLKTNFPDRNIALNAVSELVLEIKKAGYQTISEVASDVNRARNAFNEYEQATREGNPFNAIGVVRLSLVLASEKFSADYYGGKPDEADDLFPYRSMVAPR